MIDRTLKYVDLYMIHRDLSEVPDLQLPEGYSFRFFREGDKKHWIDIEVSSQDIRSEGEGHAKFATYFGGYEKELESRCVFLLDSQRKPVGTATGFKMINPLDDVTTGSLQWIAIKQEHQGRSLAKPLIAQAMKAMYDNGHKGAHLHSQTHTWLAVVIYQALGWEPYNRNKSLAEFEEGWEIVRRASQEK